MKITRLFLVLAMLTAAVGCSSSGDDDDSVESGGDGDGAGSGDGDGATSGTPAELCHEYCEVYAANDICSSSKTAEACAIDYFKCDTSQQLPGDSEECIAATVAKWDCWIEEVNKDNCNPGTNCDEKDMAIAAACK